MMSNQDMVEAEVTSAEKWHATKANMSMALGTLGAAGIIDVAAHAGPGGLFFGGLLTFIAARHGDDIARAVCSVIPQEAVDWVSDRIGHRCVQAEEEVDAQPKETAPEESNAPQQWDESWYGDDEDERAPQLPSEGIFTLSGLLASGFVPTLERIFLARLPDGTIITAPAKDLCHVALAGNTGGGKSVIMRLIVAQLCHLRVPVLLLNPHYMRYDREHDEDWTPFEAHLARKPLDCRSYAQIERDLSWMANTLLPKRIERCAKGGKVGKPYFVVIDELPAIVAEIKDAPKYLAKILREGRKYGIFLISASQDFLVKTVAGDGEGAIRKCYRTAFYVGGDTTTAKTLLNIRPADIPENQLGKGVVMLRCSTTRDAVLAHVPYVDNPALYRLLGPSTFDPNDDEEDSLSLSPMGAQHLASSARVGGESETGQMPVKAPQQVGESGETQNGAGETFTVSAEDEIAVLDAAFQIQQSGKPVTREAIKVWLGWNNKKHDIVKAVCDKRGIAMR